MSATPPKDNNAQRTRLGPVLFTAGVFALLAMIYVPKAYYGYRLIFSQEDTTIGFFQLMLSVGFAALLGAILAIIIPKLPRWTRYGIAAVLMISLIIALVIAWVADADTRANSDERNASELLRLSDYYERVSVVSHDTGALSHAIDYSGWASEKFRNAARNYRLFLSSEAANSAEEAARKADERAAKLRILSNTPEWAR
jgi:hypothetical protein